MMSKCNKCEYSERYEIGMVICWRDPANPRIVNPAVTHFCDYYKTNENPEGNKKI